MRSKIKTWLSAILLAVLVVSFVLPVYAAPPEVTAPSAILTEQSTGKVIYEKNADQKLSPASVTKIMTLYLIFEKLHSNSIALSDEVVTSAYAKSMGGSQVFLEEGEIQTVDTLIKCITVASGNDASVAMAEYIAGSEDSFVEQMNEKAAELHMENTNFVDCCGLTEDPNHYMSARDIAILSRRLTLDFPEIFNYTTIWMEDITHVTAQGSSTFTLSNTNKLLKQYPYATGLKTGSTSIAKFCLAATAQKEDMTMISVVLASPTPKDRFSDSSALLNYGFSVSKIYVDTSPEELPPLDIAYGVEDQVPIQYEEEFRYLDVEQMDFTQIKKEVFTEEEVEAPVQKGQIVGEAIYRYDTKELGRVNIIATKDVKKATYGDCIMKAMSNFLL